MSRDPPRVAGDAARADQTERTRRIWDKRAPTYGRTMGRCEKLLFGDGRARVCSRAGGEVLEVAVGTGRSFALYAAEVRLTAIELSPRMLEIARARARAVGREVDLREGDAQALPFSDEALDPVVCTPSLCNIPDDRQAIAEMKRVLGPNGRLLLLDHIPRLLPARAGPAAAPGAAAAASRRGSLTPPPARARRGAGLQDRARRAAQAGDRRASLGTETGLIPPDPLSR